MELGRGRIVCICLECDSIFVGTESRRTCISCSSEKTGYWEQNSIFLRYVVTYKVRPEHIKALVIKNEIEKYYMVEDGIYVKRAYEKFAVTDDAYERAITFRTSSKSGPIHLVVGPQDTMKTILARERSKGKVKSDLKVRTLEEVLNEVEDMPIVEVMTLEEYDKL